MKILLHETPQGIVGAWRVVNGGLESYYESYAAPEDADTAESVITLKSNDLAWDVWFDRLTERSPYFLRFVPYEAPNNEALSDTLERFQQESLER